MKSTPYLLVLLIAFLAFSCKDKKKDPDTIILSFNESRAFFLEADNTETLYSTYGKGELQISLDSVYMDITSDSIYFAFRKGNTVAHEKGIVIQSSDQPEEVLLMLFQEDKNDPYEAIIRSYDRIYKFQIDKVLDAPI